MSHQLIASLEGIPLSTLTHPYVQHEIERLSISGLWPVIPPDPQAIRDLAQYQSAKNIPLVLPLRLTEFAREQDYLTDFDGYPSESKIFLSNNHTMNSSQSAPIRAHLFFPTDLLQMAAEITSTDEMSWIIAPLCLMPTIKAILSVHRWDTHLSAHYFNQLTPTLSDLSPTLCHEIWQHKQAGRHTLLNHNLSAQALGYLQLERKLDRQYPSH